MKKIQQNCKTRLKRTKMNATAQLLPQNEAREISQEKEAVK